MLSVGASMTPGGVVVGEPAELRQRPLHEELRGQRRDREIETAQPQARQAEDDADRSGDEPGQHDAAEQRQAGRRRLKL